MSHPVEGKVFAGWADTADATVPVYGCSGETYEGNYTNVDLEETVTLTAPNTEKTLYAVWMNKYELTFYPNEAIGGYGNVPVLDPVITVENTYTFTIPAKTASVTPSKEGFDFGWWGPEENVFEDGALENRQFGDTVTLTESKPKEDYYAYYRARDLLSLTFDINGGSSSTLPKPNPMQKDVTDANIIFDIPNTIPSRSNHEFVGWCENQNPQEGDVIYKHDSENPENRKYRFNKYIKIKATLYAIWKPKFRYNVTFYMNRPNTKTYISGEASGTDGVYRYYTSKNKWDFYASNSKEKDSHHDSEFMTDLSYTFTAADYWSTRGEKAQCESDDGGDYTFLGWSEDPDALEPTYTVDANGFIQQDIEVVCTNPNAAGGTTFTKNLYAVWHKTPKHAYRLIFADVASNGSDVISSDETVAKRSSWYNQVTYYSYKNGPDGKPVTPKESKGIILKTGPVDMNISSHTWTAEELAPISAYRPANNYYIYEFEGWSYTNSSQVDIPVDENGKITQNITVPGTHTDSDDPCEYRRHCLVLHPVFTVKYRHVFNIRFDGNSTSATNNKVKYKNGPDDEWHPATSYVTFRTDYIPVSDGGSYTLKKEDFIVTAFQEEPGENATYEFLGWSTNENATQPDEEYKVDEDGLLLQDIVYKAHEDDYNCTGKAHSLILYAVWKKTPIDTFNIVFCANYQFGNAQSANNRFWVLEDGVETKKTGSGYTFFRLPDGTSVHTRGRYLKYTHGPVAVGQSSYTFPVSYWQEKGLYAEHDASSTTRYIFRGWSEDLNYWANRENPTKPLYTVGEDGYIQQPITIEIPADKVGKGGTWNKVLYAVWEPVTTHSYSLKFSGNGGAIEYPGYNNGRLEVTYSTEVTDAADSPNGNTWGVDFWQENPLIGRPYSTSTTVYNFLGWAYSPDATEPEVDMDEEGHILEPITVSEADPCTGGDHTVTLYAVWGTSPNTRDYVLRYSAGTDVTDMPNPLTERWTETFGATYPNAWVPNHTFNITTARPKYKKYVFVGWSKASNSVQAEYGHVLNDNDSMRRITQYLEGKDTITVNAASEESGRTATLYPVWWYGYEFVYNANGGYGAPVPDYGYANQNTYTYEVKDRIPEREGYRFLGWARKNSQGNIPEVPECSPNVGDYANDGYPNTITQACTTSGDGAGFKSITLYAVWEPITP